MGPPGRAGDRAARLTRSFDSEPNTDPLPGVPWVYRIGFVDDPLGFPRREQCSWLNRWDDPERVYRTLYCAEEIGTCLREVLADLRPNARVLAELDSLEGPSDTFSPGRVSDTWFDRHVLTSAIIHTKGPIIDVDDPETRDRLLHRHAVLLARLGIEHLDIAELRAKHRMLTQAISRGLWEDGAAGIQYGSNLDQKPCFALFEDRASLLPGPVGIVHFTPQTLLTAAWRLRLNISYHGWRSRYVSSEQ